MCIYIYIYIYIPPSRWPKTERQAIEAIQLPTAMTNQTRRYIPSISIKALPKRLFVTTPNSLMEALHGTRVPWP